MSKLYKGQVILLSVTLSTEGLITISSLIYLLKIIKFNTLLCVMVQCINKLNVIQKEELLHRMLRYKAEQGTGVEKVINNKSYSHSNNNDRTIMTQNSVELLYNPKVV